MPKFRPTKVRKTVEKEDTGPLVAPCDKTGASYENRKELDVPTSDATVTTICLVSPPAKAVVQRSELSLVHEAVSQDVLPNCAVAVLSLGPNCKPVRVMLEPPVVPALAGVRPQINGLLYVK